MIIKNGILTFNIGRRWLLDGHAMLATIEIHQRQLCLRLLLIILLILIIVDSARIPIIWLLLGLLSLVLLNLVL